MRGSYLPSHRLHEVLCRRDEPSRIVANHLVAALGVGHTHSPREGKHVAPVFLGNATGDESATLVGTLHQNGSVRHTGYDAVALSEIVGQCLRLTHVFRQQSTVARHFGSRVAMLIGVYLVESVRHDTDGVKTVFQCTPMGTDVHSVGQSAHDQHVGTQLSQFAHEVAYQVLSVGGALPCPHDVNHLRRIQVGGTFII